MIITKGFWRNTSIAIFCFAIPLTLIAGGSNFINPRLTALWWQWALSIPDVPPEEGLTSSIHPLVGDNESFGEPDVHEFCGVGQHGPIWFLGGDFSGTGTPFTRTCRVPFGKAMLLNVIAGECSTAEGDATRTDRVLRKAKDLVKCALDQVAPVDFAEATLDGQELPVKKVTTLIPFSVFYPPSNIGDLIVDPAANPSLSQASGFWTFIPPKKSGTYVLEFSGGITGVFEINGTYNIEIVPLAEQ